MLKRVILLTLALSGCEGALESERPAGPACDAIRPGPAPLRRLSRFEYDNTVRDLLGDATRPASRLFPVEEIGNGFGNDANSQSISPSLARAYSEVAHTESTRLIADLPRLQSFLACDPAAEGEEACARGFIERFGRRAFRRPITSEEKDQLWSLFTQLRAIPELGFESSLAGVVEASLQMPGFLYRVEEGGRPVTPGVVRIEGFEMASRLSYFLWGSTPDDELLDAAAKGELSTDAEVRAQAQRMIEDPRARAVVRYFNAKHFQLEGIASISKDATLYPDFTPEIPGLLLEETNAFLDDVIWKGPGDLKSILTSKHTFMNARLAKFYGVTGPTTDQFERVELDPARSAGVLTLGGLQASLTPGNTHTNPVVRGKYVLTRLMCRAPPHPPAGFVPMLAEADPTQTTRERYAAHSASQACSGCHQYLDPLGFAFENFDPIGRWRDFDNSKPVDATGNITFTNTPLDGPFDGPAQLADKLADSELVRDCWVGRWVTFGFGRAEVEADACSKEIVKQSYVRSKGNVRETLLSLTQTDAFLYRPQVVTP